MFYFKQIILVISVIQVVPYLGWVMVSLIALVLKIIFYPLFVQWVKLKYLTLRSMCFQCLSIITYCLLVMYSIYQCIIKILSLQFSGEKYQKYIFNSLLAQCRNIITILTNKLHDRYIYIYIYNKRKFFAGEFIGTA
jgi:hypothetical protein